MRYGFIKLANKLDELGLSKEASQVDDLIKQAVNKRTKDLFWSKVDRTPGCWIWLGAKAKNGYGIVTIDKKQYSSHRLSWEWANGKKIPKGHVVCHKCDTPSCVNPNHLFTHTQQGNVDDRNNKGRTARGPNNGMSLLKEEDIKAIRLMKRKGLTESQIAELFNVSRSAIANILHGRTWSWIVD